MTALVDLARTDHAAVVGPDGTLSYAELLDRADALAADLRAAGVGDGDLVMVRLPRSTALVVAWLGVLRAGAAYTDDDARWAVTADGVTETDVDRADPDSTLACVVGGERIARVDLRALAGWHRRAYGVSSLDRCAQLADPATTTAAWETWGTLCAGATLVVGPADADAAELRDWVVAGRIAVAHVPDDRAAELAGLSWPDDAQLRTVLTDETCDDVAGLPWAVARADATAARLLAGESLVPAQARPADVPSQVAAR